MHPSRILEKSRFLSRKIAIKLSESRDGNYVTYRSYTKKQIDEFRKFNYNLKPVTQIL
uniref:TPR domain-containing protein n=1 Tax=Gloeothece verrucosa (strain PCC 7822) TaxID=497965 RepID=E0UFK1_GLOV7|nr:TPR domain-containing protein [Gloeothece verrucosa PCC 7822]